MKIGESEVPKLKVAELRDELERVGVQVPPTIKLKADLQQLLIGAIRGSQASDNSHGAGEKDDSPNAKGDKGENNDNSKGNSKGNSSNDQRDTAVDNRARPNESAGARAAADSAPEPSSSSSSSSSRVQNAGGENSDSRAGDRKESPETGNERGKREEMGKGPQDGVGDVTEEERRARERAQAALEAHQREGNGHPDDRRERDRDGSRGYTRDRERERGGGWDRDHHRDPRDDRRDRDRHRDHRDHRDRDRDQRDRDRDRGRGGGGGERDRGGHYGPSRGGGGGGGGGGGYGGYDRKRRDRSHSPSRRVRSRRSRSPSGRHHGGRARSPPRRERIRPKTKNWDVSPEDLGIDVSTLNTAQPAAHLQPHPTRLPVIGGGGGGGGGYVNPQAERVAKRLYVGGIPETALHSDFLVHMQRAFESAGLGPSTNVTNVSGVQGKRFCWLEFTDAESATAALKNLHGIDYQGETLNVQRPKDYVDPSTGMPPAAPMRPVVPAKSAPIGPHGLPISVENGPGKLYIANIPNELNDNQFLELLRSIGPVASFNYVRDSATGVPKGYAFCRYVNVHVDTDKAISNLNGLELLGKRLVVQAARDQPQRGAMPAAVAGMMHPVSLQPGGMTAMRPMTNQFQGVAQPWPAGSGANSVPISMAPKQMAPAPLVALSTPAKETRVLVMMNMVTDADLADDEEYADLLDDIRGELVSFGDVEGVVIPRIGQKGSGRVFAAWKETAHASAAAQALTGRVFDGRTVVVGYYDEERWAKGDLE